MDLNELLWSLDDSTLRRILRRYAKNVHNYPLDMPSSKVPEDLKDFSETFVSRDKKQYVSCLLERLGQINNTQAQLHLEKLKFSDLRIPSHQDNKNALVVSLMPGNNLSKVVDGIRTKLNTLIESEHQKLIAEALENDIPLPTPLSSKLMPPVTGKTHQKIEWLVAIISAQVPDVENEESNLISLFCSHCTKDNPEGAQHCISCGRKLPQITCPRCETKNPPQAKFCMSCGEERLR